MKKLPMTKLQNGSVPRQNSRAGITLIEILISTTIMAMCMAIVATSFTQVSKAQRSATRQQKALHQGEFVMELIGEALRSSAFLGNATEKFGFRLEDEEDKYAADSISFVTSSSAFIHPGSPLKHGLHRLQISIHEDEQALAAYAYPHLIDDSEENKDWEPDDPWVVSRRVKGLNVRPYSFAEEAFEDEWETENTIPQFVEVTLFIEVPPKDPDDKPEVLELLRIIELPVGYFAREQARVTQGDADNAQQEQEDIAAQQQQQQGGAGTSGAVAVPSQGGAPGGGRSSSGGSGNISTPGGGR